jgi:hypothetical protein
VNEWVARPIEEIIEKHGERIFDSPDEAERRIINIQEYPLLDEHGRENKIYASDGWRIHRREAYMAPDTQYNGMLFNLKTLHELFIQMDSDERAEDTEDQPITPYYVYPMACLKSIGHFQARGLISPFQMKIRRLNEELKGKYRQDDEDDIASDLLTGYRPIVEGIASQGYNMLSHRVRAQGRYHDVQLGMMTAAFTGTHSTSMANENTSKRFTADCNRWLPYERYHEKISGAPVDTSTRVENVYRISLRKIPERYRNGRYVYMSTRIAPTV